MQHESHFVSHIFFVSRLEVPLNASYRNTLFYQNWEVCRNTTECTGNERRLHIEVLFGASVCRKRVNNFNWNVCPSDRTANSFSLATDNHAERRSFMQKAPKLHSLSNCAGGKFRGNILATWPPPPPPRPGYVLLTVTTIDAQCLIAVTSVICLRYTAVVRSSEYAPRNNTRPWNNICGEFILEFLSSSIRDWY